MRHSRTTLVVAAAALAFALPVSAQNKRISPHETVSKVVGGNRVTLIYGRPYTKDPKTGESRTIWGGLVPYGKVWRTGADEATTLITEKPIVLGGAQVPAGTYSVFTIPEADGGKLVINKQVGQWGTRYDEKEDLARVDLKRGPLDPPEHQFTMAVEESPDGGGVIALMWENARYSVAYKVQEAPAIEFPAASPAGTVKQRVGTTDIDVAYSRPGVKGRAIFGGLVPYDEVWRTGANSATKISFSTPVKFGGAEVPAGTYGLFAIPDKDEWTVILNKVAKQWGAYEYDPKEDVVRVKVKPVTLAAPVETFTIDVSDIGTHTATLDLTWDRTQVPVSLEVDVTGQIVPQIEAAMSGSGRKPYFQSAMFYYENNLDLKKAAAWMDQAIAAQPDAYYMIYRKGLILAKMGDKDGALAAANKSMEMARKDSSPAGEEYVRLNKSLIDSLK
jgi:hypothetical protein